VSTPGNAPVTPLMCRLNLRHTWRVQYPSEGPEYGWCIRCRKVKPTWSDWEWTDIFWMEFPGGISSASSFLANWGSTSDGREGESNDGGAGEGAGGAGGGDGGDGGDGGGE
jgi:hypothetical protein